jgi:hypothetical protein
MLFQTTLYFGTFLGFDFMLSITTQNVNISGMILCCKKQPDIF